MRRSILPSVLVGFAVSVVPASVAAQEASAVRLNKAIEVVSQGQAAFGIFSGDRSLSNARSLVNSGLDYVFIDMEHGPFDAETLQTFLLGMTDKGAILRNGHLQLGVTPIVRVPQNGGEMLQFLVKQALDMGAFGVIFPFINSGEEALNAVRSMRYPRPLAESNREPHGLRGRSPGVASWLWGLSGGEYVRRADLWPLNPDGELLAVIQIETPEAVARIEEIITTPGVGAIFIGPSDLSAQMGYGDSPGAPEVEEAIQTVLQSCLRHDIPCGLTTGANSVAERTRQGFRFVTVGGDGGITPGTAEALRIGRETAGR